MFNTRTVFLIVAAFLLCASGCGFGQTSGHATNSPDSTTSSTLFISGVQTSWVTANTASSPTTTANWIDLGNRAWINGVPQEIRKARTPKPTIADLVKTAAPVRRADLAPANYVKIALAAGAKVSAAEAEIIQGIYEHGLKVYDWAKVDDYLYNKALEQKAFTRWVWKPINDQGANAVGESSYHEIYNVGYIHQKIYARPIPAKVLEAIACLKDDMPDAELIALVSDYEVIRPDPFLAITTRELLSVGKIYIVAQWDEPKFDDGGSVIDISAVAIAAGVKPLHVHHDQ